MTNRHHSRTQMARAAVLALWLLAAPLHSWAAPSRAANADYDAYIQRLEHRLEEQHRSASSYLAHEGVELRPQGGIRVEELTPRDMEMAPGAMLHHWRGTAFVPGASGRDFVRLMQDFASYPQHFQPEVMKATVLGGGGGHWQTVLRMQQHHILTVVMDAECDVRFGQLDSAHGYTFSRSRQVREVEKAGTAAEHALAPGEEHGFLWRFNNYWSYAEGDGGLYLQVESVSLSRDIPRGLGWIVRPFVQSIPRESLEFTLSSTRHALEQMGAGKEARR